MYYRKRRVSRKDWEDYNYQKQLEKEASWKEGEEAQLSLLHDICALVFQINRKIEETTKDVNLMKILMALYFRDNLSQADIARDYGIPVGTVGNIIAKYTAPKATPNSELIKMINDTKRKRRKILKLTEIGKQQAERMLQFMGDILWNMKKLDKKSSSVKYNYLQDIRDRVHKLCRYTTGKRDVLNEITKGKKDKETLTDLVYATCPSYRNE